MARGTLRVYLGTAPGVGKTYAMLSEAHRRRERGTDIVVAYVETHNRPRTAELVEGLEMIPRREIHYRGTTFTEMDLTAVLERKPRLALVDELAHTNVPGVKNGKRWQDVKEMLDAGIGVVTNINIQHLESLNDVVEKITGVPQRETVPDEVVRAAEQVELIDMTPQALRRRMAHGNIYGAEKVDAALSNYFRVGNLTALRELALLWLAGTVDEQLDAYRAAHNISGNWPTRERIVVGLTGEREGKALIRRAARIAAATAGGDLLAVHVTKPDGLVGADPRVLANQRAFVESLGGSYHQVLGDDAPEALLDFARAENATQLVLGASRRGRIRSLLGGPGIGAGIIARSGQIDVHIVSHERSGQGKLLLPLRRGLSRRRRLLGWVVSLAAVLVLTLGLSQARSALNLTSDVLLFLLAVVGAALIGGFWPAIATAVVGSLLLNYFFVAPLHTFSISEGNNILALFAFVAVAAMVSRVVDLAARRSAQAARASAEAETLFTLAGSVLRGRSALAELLDDVRRTFGMTCATLLEKGTAAPAAGDPEIAADRESEGSGPLSPRGWHVVANAGTEVCAQPEDADIDVPVGDTLALVMRGRPLAAADRRVLGAFAAQIAVALQQHRLAEAAAAAAPLAEAERTRTALLSAVSHDLRTPLSAVKAAVSNLRSRDVQWTSDEREELLATADESLDRLIALVENLLGMSRLQAGAVSVFVRPVALDEVVPKALDDLGPDARIVRIAVRDDLPAVLADPPLLERIIANLAANAVRYSPAGQPPAVSASALGDWVELRVIDRGPGIPEADRDRVFLPFQRLGDRDNSTGVGLGLALSRGLAEAMGGALIPEETPGGGLTMVVRLPASGPHGEAALDVGEQLLVELPPGVAHWIEQFPQISRAPVDDPR